MNTILWGNTAAIQGNEIYLQAGTVVVVHSDIAGGYPGLGNIEEDPMLRGENYELSDSSRCIGAGIDSFTAIFNAGTSPIACFLGNPRPNPAGSNPDIGACESPLATPLGNFNPVPPKVLDSQATNGEENVGIDVEKRKMFLMRQRRTR